MASLFKAFEDRLAAILETGAGSARTIPSGWFRRSADRQSLLDPAYPAERFDRAYELEYVSIEDLPGAAPANPYDPSQLREVLVNLRVGYAYGAASDDQVARAPSTTETAAFAVLNARRRALEDAERIWRCLNWAANWGALSGPALVDCQRVGAAVIDDLGGGRLVCTTPLRVRLDADVTEAYLPTE